MKFFGGYERYIKQNYLLQNNKFNFSKHLINLYKREINLFINSQKFEKRNSIIKNLVSNNDAVKLKSKEDKNKILRI